MVEPFQRPGFPASAAKPATPAVARVASPNGFAVSIARSGAAYPDC